WGGRPPSAPRPQARIGGASTGPCQAVRPSLFDRARSSTWPPGQEIPFNRQLAELGVKLGHLTLYNTAFRIVGLDSAYYAPDNKIADFPGYMKGSLGDPQGDQMVF